MSAPFLSEIRVFSFGFPPKGWAYCNGQLMQINQNQALFALLGTTYGGDGRVNFALPNLQARVPIHVGSGHVLGESGGENAHTLTQPEIPAHNHQLNASSATGNDPNGSAKVLASPLSQSYRPPGSPASLDLSSVSVGGSTQPHTNQQPYLVVNICIALVGIFPSRN
jgi:microcystin-dependent protein